MALTLKPRHCPSPDRIDVQPGVPWASPCTVTVRGGEPVPPVARPGEISTRCQRLLLILGPGVFQGVNGTVTMLGNEARANPLGHFRDTRQAKPLATRRGRPSRTAGSLGRAGIPLRHQHAKETRSPYSGKAVLLQTKSFDVPGPLGTGNKRPCGTRHLKLT